MAKMGAPTKYTPELIKKAHQYLAEWNQPDKYGETDVVPTQAALATYLNLSLSTVEKWATHKDKVDFLRVLADLDQLQHRILVNKGLAGSFNSNITKMILTNHGYSDKKEFDVKGNMTCVLTNEDEDI